MSITWIPASELVSEDWQLADDSAAKPTALVIQLRRRAHVLPWFRFLYAEGDNAIVRIAFGSHLVIVSGHGLAALLAALATQRVVRLIQPTESEAKFGVRGESQTKQTGPSIANITVEPFN